MDPDAVARAMVDVEVVYHCAGLISLDGDQGGRVFEVNVDGVRVVAEAARAAGVRRLVHVSSCHAFDLDVERVHEEGPRPGPGAPAYDRLKAAGEAVLREIADLDFVTVYPGAVLGRWDFEPSHLGRALLFVRAGGMVASVPGGFHFVDVRDVVDAMIAAEAKGAPGEGYLIGGTWRTTHDLLCRAAAICGRRAPLGRVPLALARLGVPFVGAWARLRGQPPLYTREGLDTLGAPPGNFDQRKATEVLGFAPRPIDETLADAYESFERTLGGAR